MIKPIHISSSHLFLSELFSFLSITVEKFTDTTEEYVAIWRQVPLNRLLGDQPSYSLLPVGRFRSYRIVGSMNVLFYTPWACNNVNKRFSSEWEERVNTHFVSMKENDSATLLPKKKKSIRGRLVFFNYRRNWVAEQLRCLFLTSASGLWPWNT